MKWLLPIVLLAFPPVFGLPATAGLPVLETVASRQEGNKAVARRVFEEIFNQGKFDAAKEIYAQDFRNHGMHRDVDLQEDQAAARWEKALCPDLRITVNMMVAEGDLVTVLWTARGTHTGRAGFLPATGVKIEERGITIWRIVDGKIREEWSAFDLLRVIRQLGSQLKWPLAGLLATAALLAWGTSRLIHRIWTIYASRAKAI